MTRRITKLKIDEVSCVFRGAGEGCTMVLQKRDAGDTPREGSMRRKYLDLIQMIQRGNPGMRVREARSHAWNSLSEEDQFALLEEERNEMNKSFDEEDSDSMRKASDIGDKERFSSWYESLSEEERQWYSRQVRLAEDRMAAQAAANRRTSSSDEDGRGESLSATERNGYGSGRRAKSDDSLQKIAKDVGLDRVVKHLIDNGSRGVTEEDLAECVKQHAEATGETVAKIWATNTDLQKAAEICRKSAWASRAERQLTDAHVGGRMAQTGIQKNLF